MIHSIFIVSFLYQWYQHIPLLMTHMDAFSFLIVEGKCSNSCVLSPNCQRELYNNETHWGSLTWENCHRWQNSYSWALNPWPSRAMCSCPELRIGRNATGTMDWHLEIPETGTLKNGGGGWAFSKRNLIWNKNKEAKIWLQTKMLKFAKNSLRATT